MKKTVALIMSIIMMFSLMSFSTVSFADEGDYTIVFYPVDMTYVSESGVVDDLTMLQMSGVSGDKKSAFVKFDFTGYANLLAAAKGITFDVWAEASNPESITLTNMPAGYKDWSSSSFTYETASSGNYLTSGSVIGEIAGLEEYNMTSADITSSIKSALEEGKSLSDNILSLRLDVASNVASSVYGQPEEIDPEWDTRPTLTISFPADAENTIKALEASYNTLDIGDVSDVRENLDLITTDSNGVNISWESSNESLVAADGTVTRRIPRTFESGQYDASGALVAGDNAGATPRNEITVCENVLVNKPAGSNASIDGAAVRFIEPASDSVVVVATLEKDGYSMTKNFRLTVPTQTVFDASNDTYIRFNQGNTGPKDQTLIVDGNDPGNNRFALIMFDISENKDVIANSKKVEFFFRVAAAAAGGSVAVYNVSGEGTKAWSEDSGDLTGATKTNIVGFNSTNAIEVSNIPLSSFTANTEYRVDVTSYAKLQEDGILVFKIAGTGTTGSGSTAISRICSRENANVNTRPQLIVTPKSANEGEDAFDCVNAVAKELNLGDTSCVVNDIALPLSGSGNYADVSIKWTSSNPSVISNDGIVTLSKINSQMGDYPEKNAGTAVLAAEISKDDISITKEFSIKVPLVGVSLAKNVNMVRWLQPDNHFNTKGTTLVLDSWADYSSTGTRNARHFYVGFDLEGQKELFRNAKKVYLRLNARANASPLNATIEGIASGEGLKGSWTSDSITWNTATDLIAFTAPEKHTFVVEDRTMANGAMLFDVTQYIKDLDNTLAEFKVRPNEKTNTVFQFNAPHTDGYTNAEFVPALIAVLDEDYASDFTVTANDKEYFYSFPTNEITLKTTVDNSTGKYNSGFTVVYGVYDEYGNMTDVIYSPVSSVAAQKDTVVNTQAITLADKDNSFVKVFIWNGNLKPLNKLVTFPN